MNIRIASTDDALELLEIYSPYVLHTAVTFEYEIPSGAEFISRMQNISEKYPFYIAEENQKIVGYTYASPFKSRAAYDWSVETSIYIDRQHHGKGIGKMLYQALENSLALQNVCNLCACIAYPNPGSIAFHETCGYKTVAHFNNSGYKEGKWYDMIWMEKTLTQHTVPPKPFIPFSELPVNSNISYKRKDSI